MEVNLTEYVDFMNERWNEYIEYAEQLCHWFVVFTEQLIILRVWVFLLIRDNLLSMQLLGYLILLVKSAC